MHQEHISVPSPSTLPTASYPIQTSDPGEELDRAMSEPLDSHNSIATAEAVPTPTPEVFDSDAPSPTPPESTPTPEPSDSDEAPALPAAVLSPIAETPELEGDAETSKLTAVVTARSDGETISLHSQRNIIEADGSAHTVSTKTTPEKV